MIFDDFGRPLLLFTLIELLIYYIWYVPNIVTRSILGAVTDVDDGSPMF